MAVHRISINMQEIPLSNGSQKQWAVPGAPLGTGAWVGDAGSNQGQGWFGVFGGSLFYFGTPPIINFPAHP